MISVHVSYEILFLPRRSELALLLLLPSMKDNSIKVCVAGIINISSNHAKGIITKTLFNYLEMKLMTATSLSYLSCFSTSLLLLVFNAAVSCIIIFIKKMQKYFRSGSFLFRNFGCVDVGQVN